MRGSSLLVASPVRPRRAEISETPAFAKCARRKRRRPTDERDDHCDGGPSPITAGLKSAPHRVRSSLAPSERNIRIVSQEQKDPAQAWAQSSETSMAAAMFRGRSRSRRFEQGGQPASPEPR